MAQAMRIVTDRPADREDALPPPEGGSVRDLRARVEEYERGLIVSALAAAGGRQNRAAALLGVLPTTLCVKMKRMGISLRGQDQAPLPEAPSVVLGADSVDEFRWRGRLAAGATLEVTGQRGNVRAVPAAGSVLEVVARKSGRSAVTQLAISVLERETAVVFSVFATRAAAPAPRGHVSSKLRADFDLRVPAGLRVQIRLLAGNIEVVGLTSDVKASTLDGSVSVRASSF